MKKRVGRHGYLTFDPSSEFCCGAGVFATFCSLVSAVIFALPVFIVIVGRTYSRVNRVVDVDGGCVVLELVALSLGRNRKGVENWRVSGQARSPALSIVARICEDISCIGKTKKEVDAAISRHPVGSTVPCFWEPGATTTTFFLSRSVGAAKAWLIAACILVGIFLVAYLVAQAIQCYSGFREQRSYALQRRENEVSRRKLWSSQRERAGLSPDGSFTSLFRDWKVENPNAEHQRALLAAVELLDNDRGSRASVRDSVVLLEDVIAAFTVTGPETLQDMLSVTLCRILMVEIIMTEYRAIRSFIFPFYWISPSGDGYQWALIPHLRTAISAMRAWAIRLEVDEGLRLSLTRTADTLSLIACSLKHGKEVAEAGSTGVLDIWFGKADFVGNIVDPEIRDMAAKSVGLAEVVAVVPEPQTAMNTPTTINNSEFES
jgi:hypothetical protein